MKWDPLPAGRYIILYSDTIISNSPERINFIDLSVTNLAVINSDQRVFVLNRVTGFPGKRCNCIGHYQISDQESKINSFLWFENLPLKIVNDQGYIVLHEKDVESIDVYFGNYDSITASVNKPGNTIPGGLYDKDSDDGLAEYYEDNIRLNIFTDRAIYRGPGQTVFFKGISLRCQIRKPERSWCSILKLSLFLFENIAYKTAMKFKKTKNEMSRSGIRLIKPLMFFSCDA